MLLVNYFIFLIGLLIDAKLAILTINIAATFFIIFTLLGIVIFTSRFVHRTDSFPLSHCMDAATL